VSGRDAPAATAAPRAARVAVAAVFFLDGAGFASWVVRIPDVQARLALSAGALGTVLLAGALGALVAMPVAGRWVVRHGSRPVTVRAALAFAAMLPLPALAPTAPLLAAGLLALGATGAVLGVAMNAQAAAVERHWERAHGRAIMASFHALFSAGGLAGSALGGVVAGAGVGAPAHLAGVALAAACVALAAGRAMLPAGEDATPGTRARAPLTPALAALGVLAFCVLLIEGAMADWSAVYLRAVVGTGAGTAATGYAAFSLAMLAGRAVGDRVTARVGGVRLVRAGGTLAALGLALAVAAPRVGAVVTGFGLVGVGLATAFPTVLAAASRLPDTAPAAGIAVASLLGYLGFLAGPPLIGWVAEATTLRGGMAVGVGAAVLVAALAGTLRAR
jgi:MFS family permease